MQPPESDAWILSQLPSLTPLWARWALKTGESNSVQWSDDIASALLEKAGQDGRSDVPGDRKPEKAVASKWRINPQNPPLPPESAPLKKPVPHPDLPHPRHPSTIPDERLADRDDEDPDEIPF